MLKLMAIVGTMVLMILAPALQAKLKAGDEGTAIVHCPGDNLGEALLTPGSKLLVEFDGICNEDISIERGNVTIRGLDPTATIQGTVSVGATNPIDALPSNGPVFLQNLNINMSLSDGLVVGVNSVVFTENLLVTNSLLNGISVSGGGWLRCVGICNSDSNGGFGLLVATNGTVELGGVAFANNFSNNGLSGIGISSSGQLTVGPEPGVSVMTEDNTENGILVFDGGSLSSSAGTTIVANRNGEGLGGPNFGTGVAVATGASGLLYGDTFVDGNDFGILSISGQLVILGDVTATNNLLGLYVSHNGILRLRGAASALDNNLRGVQVDGSYLQLVNATYSGNVVDVNMLFGAKGKFTNSELATVLCDDPSRVLIQSSTGNVACP